MLKAHGRHKSWSSMHGQKSKNAKPSHSRDRGPPCSATPLRNLPRQNFNIKERQDINYDKFLDLKMHNFFYFFSSGLWLWLFAFRLFQMRSLALALATLSRFWCASSCHESDGGHLNHNSEKRSNRLQTSISETIHISRRPHTCHTHTHGHEAKKKKQKEATQWQWPPAGWRIDKVELWIWANKCYSGIFHFLFELELIQIQTQLTQKPMLRAEVYARALRASQNRKEDSV